MVPALEAPGQLAPGLSGCVRAVILTRMGSPKIDVQAMSAEERLDLLSRIWESFTRDPDSLPLTAAQAAELDRRMKLLDDGKMPTTPWDEIQARHRSEKPTDR